MDSFIFKSATTAVMAGDNPTIQDSQSGDDLLTLVAAGHDPSEYDLSGMHVDPVIPGGGDGFDDPLLGFEDPLLG